MNMTVLGGICKRDRQTAKHVSALLLGRPAGPDPGYKEAEAMARRKGSG